VAVLGDKLIALIDIPNSFEIEVSDLLSLPRGARVFFESEVWPGS
jgi:hypothetical protein